ncbi:hypothetical protein, unlikely [Trypanosoma brucei brucei TREU927]|uniref:Uncharacterized protein n=1 Tax=Trypanosoma brucei brucei (strain 927/4 GUTat10.1) TaxID=185431 RepID=Q38A29_TRYB2|nr:hypothetical protein, unlikely [Trypanosoma brucei brucei TREU927]EAN78341.1 hypothetical protein, unlikely [Trypanosoma brucei brucei TREU927]
MPFPGTRECGSTYMLSVFVLAFRFQPYTKRGYLHHLEGSNAPRATLLSPVSTGGEEKRQLDQHR